MFFFLLLNVEEWRQKTYPRKAQGTRRKAQEVRELSVQYAIQTSKLVTPEFWLVTPDFLPQLILIDVNSCIMKPLFVLLFFLLPTAIHLHAQNKFITAKGKEIIGVDGKPFHIKGNQPRQLVSAGRLYVQV